jgi:hypothetical protein
VARPAESEVAWPGAWSGQASREWPGLRDQVLIKSGQSLQADFSSFYLLSEGGVEDIWDKNSELIMNLNTVL